MAVYSDRESGGEGGSECSEGGGEGGEGRRVEVRLVRVEVRVGGWR